MKIGVVLALARWYHGLSADSARFLEAALPCRHDRRALPAGRAPAGPGHRHADRLTGAAMMFWRA
jgi:hypothetical protein